MFHKGKIHFEIDIPHRTQTRNGVSEANEIREYFKRTGWRRSENIFYLAQRRSGAAKLW